MADVLHGCLPHFWIPHGSLCHGAVWGQGVPQSPSPFAGGPLELGAPLAVCTHVGCGVMERGGDMGAWQCPQRGSHVGVGGG